MKYFFFFHQFSVYIFELLSVFKLVQCPTVIVKLPAQPKNWHSRRMRIDYKSLYCQKNFEAVIFRYYSLKMLLHYRDYCCTTSRIHSRT